MLWDEHLWRQPYNFGVTQSMPQNHNIGVCFFRIDSCERAVVEQKKESAFAIFFETQRNMILHDVQINDEA
jgi:hypothetical protein